MSLQSTGKTVSSSKLSFWQLCWQKGKRCPQMKSLNSLYLLFVTKERGSPKLYCPIEKHKGFNLSMGNNLNFGIWLFDVNSVNLPWTEGFPTVEDASNLRWRLWQVKAAGVIKIPRVQRQYSFKQLLLLRYNTYTVKCSNITCIVWWIPPTLHTILPVFQTILSYLLLVNTL